MRKERSWVKKCCWNFPSFSGLTQLPVKNSFGRWLRSSAAAALWLTLLLTFYWKDGSCPIIIFWAKNGCNSVIESYFCIFNRYLFDKPSKWFLEFLMNFFWKNEIDIVDPKKLLGRFFFCAGSKKGGLFVLIRSFCLLRVLKWKLIWKSSLLYLAWPDLGPFSKPHYVFIAWSNYYHSPLSAVQA